MAISDASGVGVSADSLKTTGDRTGQESALPRLEHRAALSGGPGAFSQASRAELVEHFFAAASRALDAGDLDAARVAHEAAGKLLSGLDIAPPVKLGASPPTDVRDVAEGPRGPNVVDLASARRARRRS
jgi:hypothetical protein